MFHRPFKSATFFYYLLDAVSYSYPIPICRGRFWLVEMSRNGIKD